MVVAILWGMFLGYMTNEQAYFNKCKEIKFRGKMCEKARTLKEYGR